MQMEGEENENLKDDIENLEGEENENLKEDETDNLMKK